MAFHEKHGRSIAKTVTWRVLATLTTMTLVYLFTGELTIALEIGALEASIKMVIYYLHERFWSHVHWGKAAVETPQRK